MERKWDSRIFTEMVECINYVAVVHCMGLAMESIQSYCLGTPRPQEGARPRLLAGRTVRWPIQADIPMEEVVRC